MMGAVDNVTDDCYENQKKSSFFFFLMCINFPSKTGTHIIFKNLCLRNSLIISVL